MTPQPVNKAPTANTTNLLLSAKSTRARIIVVSEIRGAKLEPQTTAGIRISSFILQLLTERVVQDQRVRHHFLPGLEPRLDLLQAHVVRQQVSTDNFQSAKLMVGRGNIDKIAIVHVEDGGCR